jgi:transcriptional regulator with XRE-family HTH domain
MSGNELKELRRKRGWTQVKAAKRLGLSQPYLALLEAEKRRINERLTRRVVRVFDASPVMLPVAEGNARVELLGSLQDDRQDDRLAKELAALGYPGFAYMKGGRRRNPMEVLLTALARPNLEARQVEALPWVLLTYSQMNAGELVTRARSKSLTNKLGFVVGLARQVAERTDDLTSPRVLKLRQLEKELSESRLVKEETLGQEDSLTAREKDWLRENRSEQARYWNLLTKWKPEHLAYAST